MRKNKTLILIAAIAVMLVAATNAYGYYEHWDGWFNSGYLILYNTYTFDYAYGSSILEDTTAGSVDSFAIYIITPGTFTCTAKGYTIKLWAAPASGYKNTGQSGQKEAYDGTWSGMAILYCTGLPPDTFDVEGTWDTRADEDYFDYTDCPCPPATPTYSAHWIASNSTPLGITGAGGSEGDRIYYED